MLVLAATGADNDNDDDDNPDSLLYLLNESLAISIEVGDRGGPSWLNGLSTGTSRNEIPFSAGKAIEQQLLDDDEGKVSKLSEHWR